MRSNLQRGMAMELEVPEIKRNLSVNEYQRLRSRSLSPDPRHLSPQPPSITGSDMSIQVVRSQPDLKEYTDPITGRQVLKQPHDHMLLSVLVLLFCMMWPTIFCAVLSVIYSFQVDIFWDIGKHEKAHSASTSAKNWAVASIICGLGIMLAVIFISTLVVFANRNNNYS